ncbi:hypothetical protein [Clostridium paraputrificum]|uniref:hypothetical protein n=1 Tax=Clostridium paraputrificum TaxID=29363 RepID=UPI0015D488DC|nr:hypothetical protein [Clostridium paraputrificum]
MLKERFNAYLKEDERSVSFVAKKINISRTTLHLWNKDERELAGEVENRLDIFLKSKGY